MAEKAANDIIEIVSQVPDVEEPPTALIIFIASDVLKAYTNSSQAGQILNELGGVNLLDPNNDASSTTVEVSLEDLYAMNPDYLFLNWYGVEGAMYDQLMEMVEGSPVWDSLSAVQNDRFILLDKGLFFNKANKRYSESYQTMAEFLYPDVF